tara:strand:- start:2314 stop:2454 length:141 start_codon:yes stop_codon:yes gene_type:complete
LQDFDQDICASSTKQKNIIVNKIGEKDKIKMKNTGYALSNPFGIME